MRAKGMLDKALIGLFTGVALGLLYLRRRGLPPLPPGPRALPLLGNVLQFREKYMWKLANDWYKDHGACNVTFDVVLLLMMDFFAGKIVYANAAGIPMIFLNDFQANEDLINKRWDKYADRPKMVMLNELCNGKYIVSVYELIVTNLPHLALAATYRHG